MSMYRSALPPYPFQSLAYGPPYLGPYNSPFTLHSLPHVQGMIHTGGSANSHSVVPLVRATFSQSASPFSETARLLPNQLNLPLPFVYPQAMPSQHLPLSSGSVQQQSSIQQPDSILTTDRYPHPDQNQGYLQHTSQQNSAYPSIPQQFFAGLNSHNQLQYSHNSHIWANFLLQNPVVTSLPPTPVQPHYTDQSLYTNVDSPAEQSFSNQPTSNQSSANLLTVEPTISHSTSASQPASLSDNSTTDSTESRSLQSDSTLAPKRPCLSSRNTLAPSLSEIEQPESCMTSVPTVASKCSQTVGILSSSNTQRVQHTRSHCSDWNTIVLESFSDSQHTESQVKMDLSGDHSTLVPTQTTMQHNSMSTVHLSLTSHCTTQRNQNTDNQASRGTQNMLTNKICQKLTPDAVPSSESSHPQLSTLTQISAEDFDLVYNTLYSVRSKWYEFGLALGLLTDTLDCIAIDENQKTEGCLRRMLCKRMEMKQLTWDEVVVAMRRPTVNRNDLAEKIEKGDLNYLNKTGAVYDLSGEPTLEELCSLPVKKVWYQLGVWLGVEDIILSQEKPYWPRDKLNWIFTAFLNLPIGTKQYKELVKELSQDLQQQAEELLKESEVNDFIRLLPSSSQTAAEELAKKRKDPKYPILITALVKVGQRKVAEEVCSRKGTALVIA